ncbi:MAG: DUF6065 family protein [Paracoccaceae bacterium]
MSIRKEAGPASTVRVWKAYPAAPAIRRAEKSALGTMPASAFQYCEAMRAAASFGWYVYPPKDISLYFDGREPFIFEDGQWFPVKSTNFEDGFRADWRKHAPHDLSEFDPPFITEIPVPGVIQIWSGYFVETAPEWALLFRPPVNFDLRSSYSVFEAVVETDHFRPAPLFINIRLLRTDTEIFLSKDRPLFQIQPLPKSAMSAAAHSLEVTEGLSDETGLDWAGVGRTLRKSTERADRWPGRYAVDVRKRTAAG